MPIDLRSDTVTRPTPAMLEAMMTAKVGDDVFGEDPSINALEAMAARLFGMEAALYCPSGTMSNQIAIKCHTQPGDEVICEKSAHVYVYEGGGIAFNSGSQVRALDGDRGRITAEQVSLAMVALENTSNRGGGSCYSLDDIKKIRQICTDNQLKLHLDGARLFNALVAKGQRATQFGELFDTISVCLNKGLGCPMGSILIGPGSFIKQARRVRKVFGGGMRQAGFMAAAGIYALENNVRRLEEDHRHARMLEEALTKKDFVRNILPVETNIVIFEVDPGGCAREIAQNLKDKGVLGHCIAANQIRFVTHLDLTPEMIAQTVEVIEQL
jgi:threonine aldolase